MDLSQFEVHAQVEEKHWWFLSRHQILLTLLGATVPDSKNTLIIDVGCGTGGNTHLLSQKYTCIGIDPFAPGIEMAKKRFPNDQFRVGYAPEDIPEIQKADAVILMDVLEHIPDDFEFISKLLKHMRPGAILVMMAPAGKNLWSRHDAGFNHERRYDAKRMRMTWEGLPVTEKLLSYCNARLYWPVFLARQITRYFEKTLGPSETDLDIPNPLVNSIFYKMFSGEKNRLRKVLLKKAKPYRHGVSLLAILQRNAGEITVRTKPADVIDQTPWRTLWVDPQ